MGYLDIAKEYMREKNRSQAIDGHQVQEIILETERMIIFKDREGRVWRRVHAWGMTWPVEGVAS